MRGKGTMFEARTRFKGNRLDARSTLAFRILGILRET